MTPIEKAVETAKSLKDRATICSVYNGYTPHPRGYKVKYDSDKLCATYISAIFIRLGWTDIVPPECGAWRLAKNMDALGRYTSDAERVPDVGDLIFFGGRSISTIDHVGIVTEVDVDQIYYYDINASVKRSTCPVGYRYIAGYGRPDYASKGDSAEPSKEDKKTFSVGDLVTINPGAKWYKGQSIPVSVVADQWYIIQVKNDRAVLGMNKAETRYIQSPIHISDITLVTASKPMQSKVTISVTIDWDTMQLLEIMATGNNKTIGECIDLLVEDAR